VTYEATNSVKTVSTNENGDFYAANLKAGGPYTIAAGNSKLSDIFLSIGRLQM
jgi:hypothetical protein